MIGLNCAMDMNGVDKDSQFKLISVWAYEFVNLESPSTMLSMIRLEIVWYIPFCRFRPRYNSSSFFTIIVVSSIVLYLHEYRDEY
jgi:hypothetical protein